MRPLRFSIRSRIYGGMGILVVLGMGLAWRGVWELRRIDDQVTRMSALSDSNTRVLRIERLMEVMREASLRLRFSTSGAALEADDATEALKMIELLQTASKSARSAQERQNYESMLGGCQSCHKLAAELTTQRKQVEQSRGTLFATVDRMRDDAGRLLAAAQKSANADIATAARNVDQAVLLAQTSNWRYLVTHDSKTAAAVGTNAAAATTALAALEKLPLPDDMRALAGAVGTSLTAYGTGFSAVSGAMAKSDTLFDDQMLPLVHQQMAAAKDVAASLGQEFASTKDATSDMIDRTVGMQELVAGIGLVLGTLLAWFVGRGIVRPVTGMTAAMSRLAAGETEVEIPSQGAGDEMGAMAKAVEVFRQNAIQRAQLEQEQKAQAERAAREKHTALMGMAERIETETAAALTDVGARAATMVATADQMSASAGRTGTSAESAAGAATQALANAQTVASAAEELAASIREIGGQVGQSTAVVGRAVAAGKEARTTIEALNAQVGRIGAVADMIGEIAAKTNLLALNATIEAARAGDAGKGFAVVASEVKQLATQTARSTEEITRHIGEVRTATGASVAAVGRIEETIDEINGIANSIAAAVEEQGAATAEIARNVTETAAAANEMTRRINEVSSEAEQTGAHTMKMRDDTLTLNTVVGELRQSVIRAVRTATADVDRRHEPRYAAELPCRVTIAGHGTDAACIADLSEHGAAIDGAPAVPVGARGRLEAERIGLPLPFVVRAVEGGKLHVAFELDAGGAARLKQALLRVSLHRAA